MDKRLGRALVLDMIQELEPLRYKPANKYNTMER